MATEPGRGHQAAHPHPGVAGSRMSASGRSSPQDVSQELSGARDRTPGPDLFRFCRHRAQGARSRRSDAEPSARAGATATLKDDLQEIFQRTGGQDGRLIQEARPPVHCVDDPRVRKSHRIPGRHGGGSSEWYAAQAGGRGSSAGRFGQNSGTSGRHS